MNSSRVLIYITEREKLNGLIPTINISHVHRVFVLECWKAIVKLVSVPR